MSRILKVVFAGWAVAFASAFILFLIILWVGGTAAAERIWGPIPLTVLFVGGVFLSTRYLR